MDTTRQLSLSEATGWRRGLYDDLMVTFRAPIVNWIIRTLTANEPTFMRYLWGQVKPVFDTRGFAAFAVDYRDRLLSGVEDDRDIPVHGPGQLGIPPARYRELQGQLATFDIVAPRLAVLFRILDRGLSNEPLGAEFPTTAGRDVTAPFPDWVAADRGRAPTLLASDDISDDLDEVLDAVSARHGLDGGIPSVHRCLAQWPAFFERAWGDLEPILATERYRTAREDVRDRVTTYVVEMPYSPRLDPDSLRGVGFSDATIADLRETVDAFTAGPAESVIPTLPIFAAMADAVGPRRL